MTVSMHHPLAAGRYGYRHLCGHHGAAAGSGVVGGLSNAWALVLAARVAEGLAAGRGATDPGDHRPARVRPHRTGPRQRSSAWAWCWRKTIRAHWRRAGGPVRLAFHLLHGGAVLPGFHLHGLTGLCPSPRPAVWAIHRGAPLDWRGLLLAPPARCALLNGLVKRNLAGLPAGGPVAGGRGAGVGGLCGLAAPVDNHRARSP